MFNWLKGILKPVQVSSTELVQVVVEQSRSEDFAILHLVVKAPKTTIVALEAVLRADVYDTLRRSHTTAPVQNPS